jgi:hypothetical protein
MAQERFQVPKAEILLVGLVHHYQWFEGLRPSVLEREQRYRFTQRIQQLVQEFQPNVILDESPDTDNAQLLAVLPDRPIPIDIPYARKREQRFNVERSIHYLCPYVDAVRERYWRRRIYHLLKDRTNARVLMFVGAKHLEGSYIKPLAFPDLLTNAGHRVLIVNLYKEDGWDHSWIEHWRHPVTEVTGENESHCCVRSGSYQKNDLRCDRKIYWAQRFAESTSS